MKYPPTGSWFSQAQAERLAEPAIPEHRWVAVSLADLAFAQPGTSYDEMKRAKEAADAAGETEAVEA